MTLRKTEIAKREIETAIDLFLKDLDFVSALGLAGAAEEILGVLLRRAGKPNMLEQLHEWYKATNGHDITFQDFARNANFTRNTLKHATSSTEDEVEIHRWETVQMLMRALYNWKVLGLEPTAKMLEFNFLMRERGVGNIDGCVDDANANSICAGM